MNSPIPRKSPVSRRVGDHRIVVRSQPRQPANTALLAEALILLSSQQAATARDRTAPHLAGIQKLADSRPLANGEATDD